MRSSYRSGGPPAEPHLRWMRLRVGLLGGFFFLLLSVVLGRAILLQVVQRPGLQELAEEQYTRMTEIPSDRGPILDRRAVPLAQSVPVDSIWIDPSELEDVDSAARLLARKLHLDPAELDARLRRAHRFAWVKRQVTEREVQLARSTDLPGLGFTKEPRRFYPQRELAAQVLGLVGTDGKGLEGVELALNDELTGLSASLPGLRDARGRQLLLQAGAEDAAQPGATVTLTIDRHIQFVAQDALARAVAESKASSGMAVVMDPQTGEILALAQYPTFNPNTPAQVPPGVLRDRVALDAFEPGSTMKSFVVAAALQEGAIRPDQTLDCEHGSWAIGRHVIHDTHSHGLLTPEQILQVSSNIGAAKIGFALGRDRLMDYFLRFGFGEKTGLALPGEAKGSVPYPKADLQVATQSFGQGISATAVQLASAYAALANHGVLMRPYLVSQVVDAGGNVLVENRPTPVRQVVSEAVARKVVHMLESVVADGGTAPRARMAGYRVAGKTGTAQKPDPIGHGYSDKRIASFAGIVPADHPRLVGLVVIDEPKTDVYGGLVAAPAFRQIAEDVLPYLAVAPTEPLAAAPLPGRPDKAANSLENQLKEPAPAQMVTERQEPGEVQVPVLEGRVGREAVDRLLAVALEPRLLGTGRVIHQTPAAGTRVPKGTKVTLELASRP